MKQRTFSILNLAGCAALAILLIVNWLGNSSLQQRLSDNYKELQKIGDERKLAVDRSAAVQQDLDRMKASLESVNHEVLTLQTELDAKKEELDHSTKDLDVAKKGLEEWQTGVTQRDERIAEMDKLLAQYKAKLDEAVARLNKVAAERKAAASKAQ